MFNRSQLKQNAKFSLKDNYLTVLLVTVLASVVAWIVGVAEYLNPDSFGIALFSLLVTGPIVLAQTHYYLALCHPDNKATINDFFNGFNHWLTGMLGFLWVYLWTVLWTLLLIVPGIIKAIAYSLTIPILAQNPQIGVRKAMKLSITLTQGYKWDLFVLDLSFIGWWVLAGLTSIISFLSLTLFAIIFGIAALAIAVYYKATTTHVYFYLRDQAIADGRCQPQDFGMQPNQDLLDKIAQ